MVRFRLIEYDVAVVGAGPSGSIAARYAAGTGARTLIIEEHSAAGSPVQCTGLVSSATFEECEMSSGPWIYLEVKGARIYAPDGTGIHVGGDKVRAYVIDRKIFDRLLLKKAAEAGAHVRIRTKVLGLADSPGRKVLRVVTRGRVSEISARVIIGADGVQGSIGRWSGLGRVQKMLCGVQIETVYEVARTDQVEVFLGSDAPGFFAWAVPVNENTARIGLCIDPAITKLTAYEHLRLFLQSNPVMVKRAGPGCSDLLVGCIPLGPQPCTVTDGIILTGDAAGQVKPTSGGGVYMGAICAKIAGDVAGRAALEGDTSHSRLMEYDRLWREAVGRELGVGMRIHQAFGRLDDDDFNELTRFFGQPDVLELINAYGDMDHPSILAGKLLTKTKARYMLGVARAVLKVIMG